MVPLVGFCGASGSGKTTLVEKVIAELKSRGLKIGAIKHHGHNSPISTIEEQANKDTSKLQNAGSLRTVLAHMDGISLSIGKESAGWSPDEIASRLMYDMDIVVVEGFKKENIDKIEVVAPGREPMLPSGGRILAIARRDGAGQEQQYRVVDANDPIAVSDIVIAAAMKKKYEESYGVQINIEGKSLPINGFSQRIVENTIRGLLVGFKGGDKPGSIEVLIEPKQ